MAVTFILNDETKVNSHGFRILNKGIDQARFIKNPVSLDAHWASNQRVIGKWENIRIEGSLLKADLIFDMEDENAKAIAGKVERGFINGVSMGINPDRSSFEMDPTGSYVLNNCELLEASVVAIPSNSNAVKLYADNGDPLTAEIVNLSLQDWLKPQKSNNQNSHNDMNEIKLSVSALVCLGLDKLQTVTNQDIAPAVERLVESNKTLAADLKAAELKLSAQAKLQATTLVDNAIKEGRIEATARESWITMAVSDYDTASKTIGSITPKVSLSSLVGNNIPEGGAPVEMTQEAFFKLSAEDQVKFKDEQSEAYTKLFATN